MRHSAVWGLNPARQRAQIAARLIAASRALPMAPDAALLLLDGALNDMLDHWAHRAGLHIGGGADRLAALDERAPAIAGRLRLALQAHHPEARLAHCWALLDLLTRTETTRQRRRRTGEDAMRVQSAYPCLSRKDSQFHVS